MRKEQLIRALAKVESQKNGGTSKPRAKGSKRPNATHSKRTNGRVDNKKNGLTSKRVSNGNKRIERVHRKNEKLKDISSISSNGKTSQEPGDRIVLMVRDAFWLHTYWEISSRAVSRGRAAMAEQWHTAKPIVRVLKSTSASMTSAVEIVERDIEIHGGVNNWYIDVSDPPTDVPSRDWLSGVDR